MSGFSLSASFPPVRPSRARAGRALAAGLCLLVGAVLPAVAQTPQTPQDQALLRQACTGDYMRLCSRFNPGGPEVEQCFQANMGQLSPQCRGAIATVTSKKGSEGRRP